jgi:hypothetical protein
MTIKVISLTWNGPGERYAYKSSFFTTWSAMRAVDLVQYTVRYKEHNPEARPGYIVPPFAPYFALSGTTSGRFESLPDAQAAAQADFEQRVLAVIEAAS